MKQAVIIPLFRVEEPGKGKQDGRSKGRLVTLWLFYLLLAALTLTYFHLALSGASLWNLILSPFEVEQDPETEFPYRPPVEWDITAEHPRRMAYTVDEVTWANVDVSPDGTTLLFDVLGDLYTVPIGGGKATLLRGGVAFERQARYSPDGTKILFTSDASGCDNIWIMELGSKKTYPVSAEPYRFVSNAMWAPNGTTVVGVKWYTSSRSIPAGEVWAFGVSASGPSAGHRLVGRPGFDNQVGPEEPVYSPDGGVVYYSKNVADGSVFQYSKDPNKGIYSVFRYNGTSGASSAVTGGSGGAARPVPSRDGRHLAFVRRLPFRNALVVRELETGNERIVFEGLSFDQQASSAPAGVYPGFAWLKGDQELVLWAQGKLWRVQVQTGSAAEIPLVLDVALDLAETVRPPYDPSTGSSFATKVAQSASLSRTSVLFNALGKTYNLPLTGGAPASPVTSRNPAAGGFEFGAASSPNGLQGVHVVWSDAEYGSVELFALDGSSAPLRLSTKTGRYAFPSFSPRGDAVAFTRLGEDSLSGPLYSQGAGIYLVRLSLDGSGLVLGQAGEPEYVCPGYRATFAADGASLLVERGSSVSQVYLGGQAQERVLAQGKYTTSISISPDLGRIAFVDFYEVYLAPFALAPGGEPMQLSTKPGSTPQGMRRLSPSGGEVLIWPVDGSSKTVSFLLGATLHTVSPDDAFSCEASEANRYGVDCVAQKTSTLSLSLQAKTAVAPSSVVLDNALLLTMEGDEGAGIIKNGRLVILGDRIQALGPREQVPIPPGARVIDVKGGVVMPGFVDVHAHWSSSTGYWVQQSWEFVVNLAFGVTTMHNPSYDTLYGFYDAELVRSGLKLGPRIFLTGTIVYGAAGSYRCEIDSLDTARAALRRLKAYGAFSVKSYQQPCRSSRQMVLKAARELDMSVVPEGGMSFHWNLNQIIDGHTTIEHALPVAPLYADVTHLFANSGTAYHPTLVVSYGGTYGENYWYQHTNVWENERLMRFSPHRDIEARSIQRPKAEDADYHHFNISKSVNEIRSRGGLIGAGAHGQRQGIAFHWELWMFSQGGMSNYEVLKSGSQRGAEALGLTNLGKLSPGYLADIIIYPADASPLEDIFNSEHLSHVIKDGRVYEAATMKQIVPSEVPLPPGPVLNIPSN